jgi:DNA segregation ATPase FtsK/SpoIIIE, S-DNA-T family
VSSPKRQPSKATMARKNSPTRRSEPKKAPARTNRQRKQPAGGALANFPLRHWSWNSLSTDRKLDIFGVFLALIGMLTILSLASSTNGAVTGWWVVSIKKIAGLGSFILPIVLILVGVWLVLRNVERLPMLSVERISGLSLLYLNILGWLHILLGGGWALADAGSGGGYLGAMSERTLVSALGNPGAYIVLVAWALIAVALTLDISVSELFHFFQKILASLARRIKDKVNAERALQAARQTTDPSNPDRVISELPPDFKPLGSGPTSPGLAAPSAPPPTNLNIRDRSRGVKNPVDDAASPSSSPAEVSFESPGGSTAQPATTRKGSPAPAQPVPPAPLPPWKVPNIADILEPAGLEAVKTNQDVERGKVIEETLASFGAPVRVVATNHGPTVTQFGVEPLYIENRNGQTRVRVAKIVALADDLALALAAPRIRIQAPVPGRNYVGIEVPNLEISRVLLREVMESEAYRKVKSPLRFAIGKDVAGHSKVYDLANMPHLLIAGTTGSGKSVCVNSLLSCLLLNNTPNELRMILVDPKRVELTGYNGVPHLLAPVVVEAEQVVGALQWVQREMDARYHRFAQVGARNIVDYNTRNSPTLPYMLVLIDELADLMMLAPDETERSLSRLAQLARATGIHLVLATQRPSVDVVTGLIKANFPARVAFAVASGIDSRVILDQPGAERLLGRGDMLFQAPDAAAPVRLQGVFVGDPEIQRLVDYWRQQAYDLRDTNIHSSTAVPVNMDMPLSTPLRQTPLWGDDENGKPGDPVLPEAMKIVREEGKASISMLQRKLRIGYTRAARLIEQLEERGIIGPSVSTSQVREVLDMGEGNNAEAQNNLEANDSHKS